MPQDKSDANRSLCPGLHLGTVLQVQVEGLGAALSNLIGVEEGLHLIIKTPLIADIGKKLYERNHIIIRYVHAGQVFGFRSTIMVLIKEPFRFCILSYPTSVEILNLRKHERISCLIPIEIRLPQGIYGGFIEDLSVGGCSFDLNTPDAGAFPDLKIGDEAVLAIKLSDNKESNLIRIVVRAMKLDCRTMKLGAQFIKSPSQETEADALEAVRSYIASFQKKD